MPEIEDVFGTNDAEDDESIPASELEKERKDKARLGKTIRELERQLKEADEKIAAFVRKERLASIESVFSKLNLNPKLSGLYNEDDVTEEAVQKWAVNYGLAPAEAASTGAETEEVPAASATSAAGFRPVLGGTEVEAAKAATHTFDDITRMLREGNIDRVNELFKRGLVEKQDVVEVVARNK